MIIKTTDKCVTLQPPLYKTGQNTSAHWQRPDFPYSNAGTVQIKSSWITVIIIFEREAHSNTVLVIT